MRQLRPAPRQTKPEPCLPVCNSSALLAESESKPVVSKHQDPLFLCGLCPVPAPAGSAVDLWQPGKTDSKHHPSQQEDRATWQVSSVWKEEYIFMFPSL